MVDGGSLVKRLMKEMMMKTTGALLALREGSRWCRWCKVVRVRRNQRWRVRSSPSRSVLTMVADDDSGGMNGSPATLRVGYVASEREEEEGMRRLRPSFKCELPISAALL